MEEGSGDVVITINRAGNLLDDISVLFVAGEIPGATGAAIGKSLLGVMILEKTVQLFSMYLLRSMMVLSNWSSQARLYRDANNQL